MKKGLATLTFASLMAVSMVGCGVNQGESSSSNNSNGSPAASVSTADLFKAGAVPDLGEVHSKKQSLTIGMTVSSLQFPVFGKMRDAVQAEAKQDGNKVVFIDAENDLNKQLSAIDNFITQKVDLVIINSVNPPAELQAINKLHGAGIPVVGLDRAFKDEAVHFVLGNDEQEGRNAADTIGEALHGKGNVVEIDGQSGVSHAIDNERGFQDELRTKYPDIKIVAQQSADYLRDKAFTVTQDILNAHPSGTIQAMFAANDNMGLGCESAIQAAHREKEMIVVGGDADKDALAEIKGGTYYGSDDREPSIMGATAYQVGMAVLNGEQSLPYAVLIPPFMVTKDNLSQSNDISLALKEHNKIVIKTLAEFNSRENAQ